MAIFSATYGMPLKGEGDIFSARSGCALGQKKVRGRVLFSFILVFLLSATALEQGRHDGGGVAVVANRNLPVGNLSLPEVRRIFLGETRYWKSNLPVVLIVPPAGTHERHVLLHSVYHMTEAQYKQYWTGRILRGEVIRAPKTAESASAARDLIASLPGSITVMNVNELSGRNNFKVIKVDGKSPVAKGYPIR